MPHSKHLDRTFSVLRDLERAASPDKIAQIESLLVHGHREQALELAVSARLWGMALVISSIIDRERYQAVVRQYADACLAAGSPAHTLSLIFSGQAAGAIQHQGRALLAPLAATRITTMVLATRDGSSIFRRKMEAWKMTKSSCSTVLSTGGRQVKTSSFMLLCTEAPSWLAARWRARR